MGINRDAVYMSLSREREALQLLYQVAAMRGVSLLELARDLHAAVIMKDAEAKSKGAI